MSFNPRDISLTVKSEEFSHAELFSAFSADDTLTFTLTVRRSLGAASPYLELFDGHELDSPNRLTFPFIWQGCESAVDTYTLTLPLLRLSGLYFASILFDSAEGTLRLSYDAYSYTLRVAYAHEGYEPFGLTVYDKNYTTPDWFKGGILYQIFVDRFAKGGDVPVREDAVLNEDWDNGIPQYPPYRGAALANNMFFGGTLWGVAEKLDYLKSLGVSAIYLSPIFKAYSNHKYDTGDYMEIDEMFGGEEAFDHLIAKAKEKNIGILLDGVFNHTGDDSRYFNKYGKYDTLGAYQSPESPWAHWFDFEEYPDRYRCWWGIDILPAVNTDEPSYRNFICGKDGVIRHYLRKGISGWRLDVADELSESLIRAIRSASRKEKSDALLLGEVWEDASDKIAYGKRRSYFCGNELDSVMNYPVGNAIIDYLLSGDSQKLFATVKRLYTHYPKGASDSCMNLLGTHDTERILTRLSGIPDGGRSPEELSTAKLSPTERAFAIQKLKLAWMLLSVMPGVPCIFYGDEAGMEGYYDPFNRRPFPWGREDTGLLDFYRKVGSLRRSLDLFAKGYCKLPERMPQGVFAISRFDEKACLLAIVNLSGKTQTLSPESLYASLDISEKVPQFKCLLGEDMKNKQLTLENMSFSILLAEKITNC